VHLVTVSWGVTRA